MIIYIQIWSLQLLRMMLHKKINPQSASRASSVKKYIEDKQVPNKRNEDQDQEPRDRTDDGCKWVKTDSECKFHFQYVYIHIPKRA